MYWRTASVHTNKREASLLFAAVVAIGAILAATSFGPRLLGILP